MNPLRKAIAAIGGWFDPGPTPKVQDPQNAMPRGGAATGGMVVDAQGAMGNSTFFACVRLIASSIGAMPLPLYRRDTDGLARVEVEHPLHKVLHNSPNADQSPVDYLEFVVLSMLLAGNHYARKVRDGQRLIGLEPLRPEAVSVSRSSTGAKRYRWNDGAGEHDLDENDIFHITSFGGGPLGGWSVLKFARNSLGLALAADTAAGAMFSNGVRPSGTLAFKDWLKPEQRDDAHSLVTDQFMGAMNAGRPMILEGGAEWKAISLSGEDAQLLESRSWSVEEVCRWFNVPPVLVGHNEKTSSWGSGIEQMLLTFLKFTLNPYIVRIEQAIRKQLLTPAERRNGYFAEFKIEGLLRADSKARADFYGRMTQIGAMTINEVRRLENLPPVEGGDVPRMQIQNAPITEAGGDISGEKK